MLAVFLSALLSGFVFCLSPGAVLAETLRRGLLHGFRPALLVQIGSLLGDALWAVIGLTGLALLLTLDAVRVPLTFVCAAYLAWLAFRSFQDAWSPSADESAAAPQARNALLAGAALSITNPKNIVFWGALGSALAGIVGDSPTFTQTTMFFAGFMTAAVLSCFISAALVDWLRRASSPTWHRVSHGLCGALLLVLAAIALKGVW
ncbi:LysE family translocator [Pseudomonas matsuisoli]|uniref:Chemotactic transduction protein ChpE n=1 Tax=Pseudomonas matsuisoli TaxID=1515666 RepID=A0A917UZL3_9PSED|nr:LysE family transporter [Pseudomonas matsuisoli]GGK00412.1 chemotactic transduction protein ChpE [Pseudomonas matsuisoli]